MTKAIKPRTKRERTIDEIAYHRGWQEGRNRAINNEKERRETHNQKTQEIEERRMAAYESIVRAVTPIVDALAHMVPYKNNGNQRP